MLNFGDKNEPKDGEVMEIPDEVFHEISITYFKEVYERQIAAMNEMKKEISDLNSSIKKIESILKEMTE